MREIKINGEDGVEESGQIVTVDKTDDGVIEVALDGTPLFTCGTAEADMLSEALRAEGHEEEIRRVVAERAGLS